MGVYASVLAQKKTFSTSSQEAAFLQSLINSKTDPAPSVGDAANAVHTLAVDTVDHTGGDFTLTFTLRNGETFTTLDIAFDANAATIEGAIDTAATAASITGWTNGDITVAGGNLQSATPVTLTFDGDSVAGLNHAITVFTDSMTGGTSPATRVSITTAGQTARPAWGVLHALNVITGSIPAQTAAASTTSVTAGSGPQSKLVPAWFVRSMAREAAAEDDNTDSYVSIISALGYEDRAPKVEITETAQRIGKF